jgi:hypothetical protein
MKKYQILVSGYSHGYLTTELLTVYATSLFDAATEAEKTSTLDGASAKI